MEQITNGMTTTGSWSDAGIASIIRRYIAPVTVVAFLMIGFALTGNARKVGEAE